MTSIVLDLPAPPSVNRLRLIGRPNGSKGINVTKSPAYKSWIKQADLAVLQFGQFKGMKKIHGKFIARVVLKRSNVDLDNHAKGLMDWLQSRGVIENDKHCERLTLEWGEAPTGCRVEVRACV